MKRYWPARVLKFALIGLLAITVFSFVLMSLWNWLMPAIFGFRAISFWQALGLLALSRILVGGFRGGPGRRMHWRHRMRERWNQMTPEERAQFVAGCKRAADHLGHLLGDPPRRARPKVRRHSDRAPAKGNRARPALGRAKSSARRRRGAYARVALRRSDQVG